MATFRSHVQCWRMEPESSANMELPKHYWELAVVLPSASSGLREKAVR